jgi:hypothetical protein
VFLLYSLIISSGAFPVYFLARKVLDGATLPTLLSLYYLVLSPIVELNVFRLKGDAIAVPLLLFAFYFYWEKRFRPFVLFSLLSLMCKETVALCLVFWGLFALLEKRSKRWVLFPLVAASCVLVFTLLIYHPYIQGFAYKHSFFKEPPWGQAAASPFSAASWAFLLSRFFPYYALVALLRPKPLLLAAPLLVAPFVWRNLLQDEMMFHSFGAVYPFLFVAIIWGTARLISWLRRLRYPAAVPALLILASIAMMIGRSQALYELPRLDVEGQAIWELIDLIPKDSSVSAPPLVLAPLSNRKLLHSLVIKDWRGQGIDVLQVDFVLLNTVRLEWSRVAQAKGVGKLDKKYLATVSTVRSHPSFELVATRLDWELYRRTE